MRKNLELIEFGFVGNFLRACCGQIWDSWNTLGNYVADNTGRTGRNWIGKVPLILVSLNIKIFQHTFSTSVVKTHLGNRKFCCGVRY